MSPSVFPTSVNKSFIFFFKLNHHESQSYQVFHDRVSGIFYQSLQYPPMSPVILLAPTCLCGRTSNLCSALCLPGSLLPSINIILYPSLTLPLAFCYPLLCFFIFCIWDGLFCVYPSPSELHSTWYSRSSHIPANCMSLSVLDSGYFQSLTIVNCSVMHSSVQISFLHCTFGFLGSSVELLGPMEAQFLEF